jgi:hypothetical protein
MVKVESVLKWKAGGPLLKKLKLLRAQVLSKNEEAVAIPDDQLHITLASGPEWKKIRGRAKSGDFDEPDFTPEIEPSIRTMTEGTRQSWYVKMRNQRDWKEYVMDSLQGGYDKGRVYHITLANLTGRVGDSIAMVEQFITEDITLSDLKEIERYADKLFAAVGIDVEFTKHFHDRANDPRNDKPITTAELLGIFKRTYKKYGKRIRKLNPGAQGVIKDMRADINMPFVINIDKNGMLDLVAKTVMRKKNFKTSNMELPI